MIEEMRAPVDARRIDHWSFASRSGVHYTGKQTNRQIQGSSAKITYQRGRGQLGSSRSKY